MKKILRNSNTQNYFATAVMIILVLTGYSFNNLKATDGKSSATPVAVVHADQTGTPIHRYIYGMFSELVGNQYDKGIWAEILSDRKFFYPVNSSETLVPINSRRGFNRWRPIGPDAVIIMDKGNPYVGEQSVRVKLNKSEVHGIQQSGIGLSLGRKYTGYIILSGDADAKVTVTMVWGTNPGDKQSITLQPLTKGFVKYPLNFTSRATTIDQGRFEISGTGDGTFSIGTVSLMPADNIKGFRADLVSLLKVLNSGIYLWPGGNMLAGYDWHYGIGNRDKRPTRYDYAWNCIESNDVGTDDFLNLCGLLNVDPYLVVNIGFGEARSAAEWVEYVNGSKDTPMGKLRAANGHPEPYKVKIWGIGNEMYGVWQLGHMSIEHYIIKHKMFVEAMRKVDPTIKIVACGATIFEINTHHNEINPHHILSPNNPRVILPVEKVPYKYGSLEDWSYQLLANDADYFDYLSEHVYPAFGSAYDESQQKFVAVQDSLPERVRKTANRIKAAAEAMHEYMRRLPELKAKNITYFLNEWSSGRRGFERTLVVGEAMHEIFRNSDVYTMSGYTSYTGNIAWNANEAVYSSIGLFFKLYREHFGTIPLTITGDSPQKELRGIVLVDIPEKSSGSDTYPLDVMAALSADKKKLTLSIINPTFTDQEIDISFSGVSFKAGCDSYQIQGPSITAANLPGEKPQITVVNSRMETVPGTFKVTPLSITLYEMVVN
jgi:alpha-N-arabinofuranosidase